MDQRSALLSLVDALCAHEGVTHYAISMRALGKGDFFKRLRAPRGGCTIRTAEHLMRWFDANWPEDLPWPAGVARPSKLRGKEEA